MVFFLNISRKFKKLQILIKLALKKYSQPARKHQAINYNFWNINSHPNFFFHRWPPEIATNFSLAVAICESRLPKKNEQRIWIKINELIKTFFISHCVKTWKFAKKCKMISFLRRFRGALSLVRQLYFISPIGSINQAFKSNCFSIFFLLHAPRHVIFFIFHFFLCVVERNSIRWISHCSITVFLLTLNRSWAPSTNHTMCILPSNRFFSLFAEWKFIIRWKFLIFFSSSCRQL